MYLSVYWYIIALIVREHYRLKLPNCFVWAVQIEIITILDTQTSDLSNKKNENNPTMLYALALDRHLTTLGALLLLLSAVLFIIQHIFNHIFYRWRYSSRIINTVIMLRITSVNWSAYLLLGLIKISFTRHIRTDSHHPIGLTLLFHCDHVNCQEPPRHTVPPR